MTKLERAQYLVNLLVILGETEGSARVRGLLLKDEFNREYREFIQQVEAENEAR